MNWNLDVENLSVVGSANADNGDGTKYNDIILIIKDTKLYAPVVT